jgi:hypothetical protein
MELKLNNVHSFCKHSSSVHQVPVWTLSGAGGQNVAEVLCVAQLSEIFVMFCCRNCIYLHPATLPYYQNSLYENLLTVMWPCI